MARRSQLFIKGGRAAKTRVTPLEKTRSRRRGPPIDKSKLVIAEPERLRDKRYLRLVAEEPSVISGRRPVQVHHLKAQLKARGLKTTDTLVLPLTPDEHDEVEKFTSWPAELAWWQSKGIQDPIGEARFMKHRLLDLNGAI